MRDACRTWAKMATDNLLLHKHVSRRYISLTWHMNNQFTKHKVCSLQGWYSGFRLQAPAPLMHQKCKLLVVESSVPQLEKPQPNATQSQTKQSCQILGTHIHNAPQISGKKLKLERRIPHPMHNCSFMRNANNQQQQAVSKHQHGTDKTVTPRSKPRLLTSLP